MKNTDRNQIWLIKKQVLPTSQILQHVPWQTILSKTVTSPGMGAQLKLPDHTRLILAHVPGRKNKIGRNFCSCEDVSNLFPLSLNKVWETQMRHFWLQQNIDWGQEVETPLLAQVWNVWQSLHFRLLKRAFQTCWDIYLMLSFVAINFVLLRT